MFSSRSAARSGARPIARIAAATLAWLTLACNAPAEQGSAPDPSSAGVAGVSPEAAATVREEVQAFLDAYRAGTESLDVEALADMYSESPEFYWVEVGRGTYESAAEIREGLRGLATQVDEIAVEVDEVRVTPLTRDVAAVTMRFRERMSGPDMPAFAFSGVITAVVVREQGAWRFMVGHATTESTDGGD